MLHCYLLGAVFRLIGKGRTSLTHVADERIEGSLRTVLAVRLLRIRLRGFRTLLAHVDARVCDGAWFAGLALDCSTLISTRDHHSREEHLCFHVGRVTAN